MPPSSASLHLIAGALIADKYRLISEIGRGAMGVVWSAVNETTGRGVALKLIAGSDPSLRQRLVREARSCGALRHENIVDVFDVARLDGGDPCMVMELLSGESVAALLASRRRLEAPLAARIAHDVAGALAAAHAVHIVHRDLKPANLFLHRPPQDRDFVVKVLDFGVAKTLGASDGVITTGSGIVGSPFYMSPEQARAEDVDHRADLWALGVVLFEMLTGVRPFQGEGPQILSQILHSEIPKVSRYLRHVDGRLVGIVDRCLRREREERFQSADEIAACLKPCMAPVDSQRPGTPSGYPSVLAPSRPPPAEASEIATPFRPVGLGASVRNQGSTPPPQDLLKTAPLLGAVERATAATGPTRTPRGTVRMSREVADVHRAAAVREVGAASTSGERSTTPLVQSPVAGAEGSARRRSLKAAAVGVVFAASAVAGVLVTAKVSVRRELPAAEAEVVAVDQHQKPGAREESVASQPVRLPEPAPRATVEAAATPPVPALADAPLQVPAAAPSAARPEASGRVPGRAPTSIYDPAPQQGAAPEHHPAPRQAPASIYDPAPRPKTNDVHDPWSSGPPADIYDSPSGKKTAPGNETIVRRAPF